jgi:hypothetical protein
MKQMHRYLTAAAVLAAVAAVPSAARAQSAQVGARATVQQALTIAAVDSLILGNAFPGTTRSILPSDAASGSWSLAGAANAEVTLTFTLPANLSDGVNNLPITFGATSAGYNTANSRAGLSLINPAAVATTRLDGVTGALYVFIGGSVSPTTQPAGNYSAAITLATAYTGN